MAQAKVQAVLKAAVSPVVSAGRLVERKAAARVARWDCEFGQRIATHKAAGTDLAAATTESFINDQFRLLPYRVERMGLELRHVLSGEYCRNYTKFNAIHDVRFAGRCFAWFLGGYMLGRLSIFPLIEPTSPFVESLKHMNPNR